MYEDVRRSAVRRIVLTCSPSSDCRYTHDFVCLARGEELSRVRQRCSRTDPDCWQRGTRADVQYENVPNRQVQRSSFLPFLSSYLPSPPFARLLPLVIELAPKTRDERLGLESMFAYLELGRSDEGEAALMGPDIPVPWCTLDGKPIDLCARPETSPQCYDRASPGQCEHSRSPERWRTPRFTLHLWRRNRRNYASKRVLRIPIPALHACELLRDAGQLQPRWSYLLAASRSSIPRGG